MSQIARDKTFFDIAQIFAERSTCLRGKVGAVIVDDRHIIAHGYNGAPPGQPECLKVGCDLLPCRCRKDLVETETGTHETWCPENQGCQRAIHAEANAILYAARQGVSCKDTIMYSTHEPCRMCALMIASVGIYQVNFRHEYRLGRSDILRQLGVIVVGPPTS